MSAELIVIGGGLAGSEAAWQAAERGVNVALYEMRPVRMTPAHRTGNLAELVCSTSFKGKSPTTAHGLLKEEMRRLGSALLPVADEAAVPAGEALAVDVPVFSALVTEKIAGHPRITVVREEVTAIPDAPAVIISTGPLTTEGLSRQLASLTGDDHLYFYDAIAPTVDAETIDRSVCFAQSRYDKGEGEYLNCPMDEEEYRAFREALLSAELAPMKDFEPMYLFEGCLPIEELAGRGEQTMAYGPMKPVGLVDPRTGQQPFAVVQLRQENQEGTRYGLVGFQTRLKYPEQKRVFRTIPGLENAEFVRYGQMHRNTYLDSPRLLQSSLRVRSEKWNDGRALFVAGQLCGVEGYMESAAAGIVAGANAARFLQGLQEAVPPAETMVGSLLRYVSGEAHPTTYPGGKFVPMNSNFGLMPPLEGKKRKKADRILAKVERARDHLHRFIEAEWALTEERLEEVIAISG
ncbi:MAG: methylenetetrahydrofolate--tRNA-(uracil(54)-C(5))-methyltransferase (FADH(2)-oxidizing) TrmFO [Armatimonadetes bacterium]|nr:methylenetetrahydrofolate--tRNA-(uracil(54)-C(5))-methyltransferase (FADH(2)-oxidizing) TrmFO [Armatimonadota bacterium]